MRAQNPKRQQALTATDVLILIALAAILGVLLLPALANNNRRPHRLVCVSNVRQVSLAFIVWVHDQEKNSLPFRVPFWEGGTQVPAQPFSTNVPPPAWSGQQNNLWFQYAWLSNELSSPKVLVCSSDKEKKPAENWGTTSKGFRHLNHQDKSASYNLWPDAGRTGGKFSFEGAQEQILLSDRNLNHENPTTACSSGITSLRTVSSNTTVVGWQREKKFGHGESGVLALLDGSAISANTTEARKFFQNGDDNGNLHYMWPR